MAASNRYFSSACFEPDRLHHVGMHGGAMRQRRNALAHAVLVDMHAKVDVTSSGHLIAKRDHLAKFPGGIHVQHRQRRHGRVESLAQQVQQHRGILADRIQHYRTLKACLHLAENVDALGFEIVEVGGMFQCVCRHGIRNPVTMAVERTSDS